MSTPPVRFMVSEAERVKVLARMERNQAGCLLWTGAINGGGYGVVRVGGGQRQAHRVAYQIAYGEITDLTLFVCHTCDVRACCEPSHLYLGSPADNMRDRDVRGRAKHPIGERNGQARLGALDVSRMRREHAAGATSIELAAAYGISRSHCRDILQRLSWRSVA